MCINSPIETSYEEVWICILNFSTVGGILVLHVILYADYLGYPFVLVHKCSMSLITYRCNCIVSIPLYIIFSSTLANFGPLPGHPCT